MRRSILLTFLLEAVGVANAVPLVGRLVCGASTPTLTTSVAALPSSSTQEISTDGTCSAGISCLGSIFGNCCSQWGWCGSTPAYCGTGCQTIGGICGSNSEVAVAANEQASGSSEGISSGQAAAPSTAFIAPTSSVVASVSVLTSSVASGTAQILPPLSTQNPNTSGTINTSLNTNGVPTSAPVISTWISTPTSIISPTGLVTTVLSTVVPSMTSENIFQPVATDEPPSVIPSRPDHPVPRLGINQEAPISTNKFYANFFLGSQTAPSFTHPYSVAWSKGGGSSASWGMAISHLDDYQKVFGPTNSVGAASYFINPVGIQSVVLSEASLGAATTITMDSITDTSINVNFLSSSGAPPVITFPLVQGMGFVTAEYSGGTPILQTGVFFRSLTQVSYTAKSGVTKYNILLEDGKTWLLYAISPTGQSLAFTVVNNGLAQATSGFTGIIQIAKSPNSAAEALYDVSCGAYAKTTTISGSVQDTTGLYTLTFTKAGMADTTLLMFALPHHLESFAAVTAQNVNSGVVLATTTKGSATAVIADSWTLQENLPTTMSFGPWRPETGDVLNALSATALATIHPIAALEVSQDMSQQSNLNSMYFSGKALAKFASIVYTLHDLLNDPTLAQAGLENLEESFALFAQNTQQFPLVYETAWGGIVSTASYVLNDPGADFGNSYYNDHHFHYGYFIYTAAVIAYLDPAWLTQGQNKAWVNALVRDIANPSSLDAYFPISRNFDWYHGHSWAHGLFETFDGKDEESSSEDAMSAYAIKLWGHATGDSNMEARGNLQLAITARSLQNYFLYSSTNTNEPSTFTPNKVSGILFENKIDHTTYFGTNPEYIQGIHMLPLLPCSTLTRTKEFVGEEWSAWFDNGRADVIQGGWKGIVFANLAISDPVTAWEFFADANFDASWLDGGASQTWYLTLAAGWGGAPA